ncbi:GNAT family N-acetyltransferase [Rhizobium leguminosarum]|uniref:GNAT family N-acetyltransferase n=1 Tax=Rhizobium leguminosarum TaxID=384 RepID=UPI001C9064C9|nr:GNAT family N-acetyltransferase [Rhizobium leguminosarum]MBY3173492.1 GNAT family N-acetyltransferase [Rhizobium leguminosarum]MBY5584853.1 GNAT family N-acetyltransferase [Rhizobium leguminosarum]MBY5650311.1 GNAT family N-acetyltransferase [Rhizobium leguminosarum]
MTMRPASPDDLETIATLTSAAYRPYSELFGAPPMPVTEDYTPRIERGEVWLCEIGGQTAGLVVVEQHSNHLMLFSIAVSPGFQGAGHGLAMLRWLEGKAREWAVPEIRLYTNARMERNIALYSAFGFQETGRRPSPYRPGWTLVDMTKEIDAA